MNIVKIQAQFETNNVTAEVRVLREEANNQIRIREVAREWVNKNLKNMPIVIGGTYTVHYTDERGEERSKEQSKNLALWLVALQTTIEVGHTTYELLGNIFSQWAKDTLSCEWKVEDAISTASKFVETMRELRILKDKKETIEFNNETGAHKAAVNKLSEEFLGALADLREEMVEHTHMKCAPLRNKPMDWEDAKTGVAPDANLSLIKGKVIRTNKISKKVLAAVNKLQSVGFKVSPHIIDAAYDLVDNARVEKCTVEDLRLFAEIKQYENGTLYFPVTMDTRGRIYYRGGLLSPQGNDFCKAAFQFAEGVALGEDGCDALCIHTANQLGFDKLSVEQRIDTVYQLVDDGEFNNIQTYDDVRKKWPGANKFQALVAIKEIQAVVAWEKAGKNPAEFISHLVCHQDGTCNGLQHMAALTKDLPTAITVNCTESTPSDTPLDIYGIIADEAAKHLVNEAKELCLKYGRNMAKNPVMITGYGAGEQTVVRNTAKFLAERGENSALAEAIGKAYIRAIDEKAGAVRTMTEAIKSRVETALETGVDVFWWRTADGFLAATDYRDLEPMRVRAGVFNALMRSEQELDLDEVKTVGAMCPNFVHSIDSTHLRMVVNNCDWDLVTIHDSIGCHAGHYHETARVIREQFVNVHQYDALGSLCNNMQVRKPNFRGEYTVEQALKSTYIFS